MKTKSRVMMPAALALVAASALAQAQTQAQTQGGPPQRPQQAQPNRQPPSPETMARLDEGRIAGIKAALKLTDAQQKLWEPVEAQLRARQAARAKAMQERSLARQQNAAPPPLTERLDRRTAELAQRAEQEKAFAAAFKPFFAALTDEQKPVAERLLVDMRGGGRGHAGRGFHHGMQRQGSMRPDAGSRQL